MDIVLRPSVAWHDAAIAVPTGWFMVIDDVNVPPDDGAAMEPPLMYVIPLPVAQLLVLKQLLPLHWPAHAFTRSVLAF